MYITRKEIIKHWEKPNKWNPLDYLYYVESDGIGAKGSNDVDFALDEHRRGKKVFLYWKDYVNYTDSKVNNSQDTKSSKAIS